MKPVLLCLHGWGGSKESFDPLVKELKGAEIDVLVPDLPGFGSEPEPSRPWNVDDFVDWAISYLNEKVPDLSDREIFLLGHSHGGRISIKIAANEGIPLSHLYLCAAAGIRHKRHIKRIIGLTLSKTGKTLLSIPGLRSLKPIGKKLMYKIVRVHDYEKASETMRKTLVNVSAEDLRPLLKDIKVRTDIFWGKQDSLTPFSDAKIMEAEITDSILHSYPETRHAVHKTEAKDIAKAIITRVKQD
ncbi:alpha/beta fold hydrolase [Candidatus Peregrinibacteria bacterium]|jgi:pimeloyl-ACP methyl ester carboxylesterase|nr:alpha/beta fold hydrolase [Candidatus Peregrinibacteria bacterium]MBT3599053.1 alpha/beta fold hydrolase [Candidatus Peregrinibacteria bacterium]MBT6730641.1 alpha/beta fold hydrolase [Candidatus Peregrinibacteria bacterium]MBT7009801.1 alpha/beta fold hydrolase [Candidatus Peregrinibacteria bacterium]MBT7344443.1 alpha/beta fold hydrolase [Candidatus Peregrinibacteria bacterium]